MDLNNIFILLCAALVFLMQAGFLCFEVGMARQEHTTAVAVKNLVDWGIASLIFYLVGFGMMFGGSVGGIVGTDGFLGAFANMENGTELNTLIFFIFQLTFAGTALTIVSGALVERITIGAYMVTAAILALVIYPMMGHWAWGGLLKGESAGWLAELGFHDFAGATVVHSTGAWMALVGVIVVGPRLGRYSADGELREFKRWSPAFAMLGVLILWVGWWGFNAGSVLAADISVADVLVNTNLAGAAAMFSGFIYNWFFQNREDLAVNLAAAGLAGLVAITASADVAHPLAAIVLGLVAGVLHDYVSHLVLHRFKIDDALGIFPVHGAAGVLGTLAVPFVARSGSFEDGLITVFSAQLVGVLVCFTWVAGSSYLLFTGLKATIGLRVSPDEERTGRSWANPIGIEEAEELAEERAKEQSILEQFDLEELL